MANFEYDFSGWATRNDLKCSDGRTIRRDAFKDCDGKVVPLVWNHDHNEPGNVLGHALLENRPEGVYTYGKFNATESGITAKSLVGSGDVTSLSIYANQLKHAPNTRDVIHGAIREVSLVLAGANPGAFIDTVIAHSEDGIDEEAIIFTDEEISFGHTAVTAIVPPEKEEEFDTDPVVEKPKAKTRSKSKSKTEEESEEMAHAEKERTVKDVFDEFTDEQKTVVYALISEALDSKNSEDSEEGNDMKQNVFENDNYENTLSHSEVEAIFADGKRYGSLKESCLAHGITDIDYLFPDAQTLNRTPDFIKREDAWVSKVLNGAHHSPFSRVKSIHANITEADARAKGYIKGNFKVEEVFGLLKRETTPTTIYKKQKLDRDDIIDITDFDVIAWMKSEMRGMLDEEIARAVLVGDGRNSASDDKINEQNIRPIWTDDDLYTIKQQYSVASNATTDQKAKAFIRNAIKARKDYKGSGSPVLFTTEDIVTDCLLMEDLNGRIIYDSVEKLATAMRVKEIVTVPVMENLTRVVSGTTYNLMGIIVNMGDYNIGADKGGSVSMFDDFDLDYNAQKYLIETRCSGALVKPYSAIALEMSFQ